MSLPLQAPPHVRARPLALGTTSLLLRVLASGSGLGLVAVVGVSFDRREVVAVLAVMATSALAVSAGDLGIGAVLSSRLASGTDDLARGAGVLATRVVVAAVVAVAVSVGASPGPALVVGCVGVAVAWTVRDHAFAVVRAFRGVSVELLLGPTIRLVEVATGIVWLLAVDGHADAFLLPMAAVTSGLSVGIVLGLGYRRGLRPARPVVRHVLEAYRTGAPLFVIGSAVVVSIIVLDRIDLDAGAVSQAFMAGGLRGLEALLALGATWFILRPFLAASATASRQRLPRGGLLVLSVGGVAAYLAGGVAATATVRVPAQVLLPGVPGLAFVPVWFVASFALHQAVALGGWRPRRVWLVAVGVAAAWVAVWIAPGFLVRDV